VVLLGFASQGQCREYMTTVGPSSARGASKDSYILWRIGVGRWRKERGEGEGGEAVVAMEGVFVVGDKSRSQIRNGFF